MTAKINKDVTEDAEDVAVDDEQEQEATPKPAKKKVRRVRVIEVIDDEDDGGDLSDVLEALDEDDDEPAPKPKPKAKVEPKPEPEVEEPPPPVTAQRTVLGASPLVAAVVILLVAALATLSVVMWRSQSGLAAKQNAREDIEKRVTDYGNAVLTYDRNNVQGSVARVQSFLTGDALNTSKQTDVNTLKTSLDKGGYGLVSKAEQVYVGSVDGKFASAVLVFGITVQSPSGPQTVGKNYLNLGLVKQGGTWMISKQKPAGRETDTQAGPQVPGTTPPSTKPSTTPKP